jgi:hypothetical protein
VAKITLSLKVDPEILQSLRMRLKLEQDRAAKTNLPTPTMTWVVTEILREGLRLGLGPLGDSNYREKYEKSLSHA